MVPFNPSVLKPILQLQVFVESRVDDIGSQFAPHWNNNPTKDASA